MRHGRLFPFLILLVVLGSRAHGYQVGRELSLDELGEQSDLVAKVEAIESEVVTDPAFPKFDGYQVFATRLKVISVLKGDTKLSDITFHHYGIDPHRGGNYEPTVHRFTPKQSYILFARKTDEPTVFRTFSFGPTMSAGKELLQTANADPLPKQIAIKDALWRECKALLADERASDIAYAIRQLDIFSLPRMLRPMSPGDPAHEDFSRDEVLDLISPFLADKDPAIADTALQAIGRASPYLSQNRHWLATVGKGQTFRRGLSTYRAGYANHLTPDCRAQLVALGNSPAAPELRARAIRSLGLSRENEQDDALLAPLRAWSNDPAPLVRAAAAVLWADYPSKEATAAIQSLASDQDAIVRAGAAFGIGCAQTSELVGNLDTMLNDSDEGARDATAVSLLSFDPKVAAPVLKAHLQDARYHFVFVNALADGDPAAYRDDLVATLAAKEPSPGINLDGQIPTFAAWNILMAYVSKCEPEEIRAGKLDKYLDALETPPIGSSGPYQTLYRFYHDQGLTDRMQSFRAKALTQVRFDLDMYFKRIDGRK